MPDVAAAAVLLEHERSYYLAAVASLAHGDRPAAARQLAQAIANFPQGERLRAWGARHALLDQPAV